MSQEYQQNAPPTQPPSPSENIWTTPVLSDYEVLSKIEADHKPESKVPVDLPQRLVTESAPKIASLLGTEFKNIINSAKQGIVLWPDHWDIEHGTPNKKTGMPLSEDNVKILSLLIVWKFK